MNLLAILGVLIPFFSPEPIKDMKPRQFKFWLARQILHTLVLLSIIAGTIIILCKYPELVGCEHGKE
jgi:hypothetical protein